MRILLGIVIGALLGGLIYDGPGAALGFLVGLVAGLIWYGKHRETRQPAPAPVPAVRPPSEADTLRARLTQVEARLAHLERTLGIAAPALAATGADSPSPDAAAAMGAAEASRAPVPDAATDADAPLAAPAPREALGEGPNGTGIVSPAMASRAAAMAGDAAIASNVPLQPSAGSAATPAMPPARPSGPSLVQRLLSGNLVAKLGILILFVGVSFFIKFALENAIVPVGVWFALAAIGGAVLLAFGWRLRDRRTQYALILQGGGIGVLYLVIFGAMKLYQLLPPTFAFILLVAVVGLAALLAILQDALSLAVVGATGGFVAPILVATGQGNHVALFTYYAILNAGIFGIAWFKAWRVLNLLGFFFTAGIGFLWGTRSYTPELFPTTEPFVILFFAMYVAIAVLFALRQAPDLKHYVDGTIVFGTPLVGFGLQAAVIRHVEFGMAFSALAMGLVYLLLARILYARRQESLRLLVESFFALALIFGTLAIPLALEARWTSAAWALEGAAVLWAGIRQRRVLARAFGLLLQVGAGVAFVADAQLGRAHGWPLLDSVGLGMLMIAAAGLFSAWQMERARDVLKAPERDVRSLVFVWGCIWWLALGIVETDRHVAHAWRVTAALLFLAGSAVAFSIAARGLEWRAARWPALVLLPFFVVLAAIPGSHPFAAGGWFAWPIALAVHVSMLRRHEHEGGVFSGHWLAGVHAGTALLVAFIGALELHWWPARGGLAHTAWTVAAVVVVPSLVLWALASRSLAGRWPLTAYVRPYVVWAGRALAVLLVLWMWYANLSHDGTSTPLPYLPIINALDLGHLLAGLALLAWLLRMRDPDISVVQPLRVVVAIAGATAFVWLNGILLRTIHHWAGIPYTPDAMADSLLVQTALSIFWTLIAFALMLYARMRRERVAWMIGATLMSIVVVKLFLVDLSQLSGIERIVSFIGVGVLMLLMGYFVPLPPKTGELAEEPAR